MTIRLQEVHPSLVHFPIALLPVSIGTDAVGRATGNRGLLETARHTIELAAVGSALAGISGLIAQEEVEVEVHPGAPRGGSGVRGMWIRHDLIETHYQQDVDLDKLYRQAVHFAEAIACGQKDRWEIIKTVVEDKVREVV